MIVKPLTEHRLDFLSLKEAAQARLILHLSKRHIVGNHMSRLIYDFQIKFYIFFFKPGAMLCCLLYIFYFLTPILSYKGFFLMSSLR